MMRRQETEQTDTGSSPVAGKRTRKRADGHLTEARPETGQDAASDPAERNGEDSIGTLLRQTRRQRKLSISDVGRDTKIQPWVIEAIEADRLQSGMSPIYVKGFLTTYARYLRLDPQPLLSRLQLPHDPVLDDEQSTGAPPAFPISFNISWASLRRWRGPLLAAACVAALIVVKPMRWLPSMNMPALQQASVSVGVEFPPKVTPEALTQIPAAAATLQLSIVVRRPTWVRVRADGELVTQQRLARGAEETWKADERLDLIVAKPSQVDLVLNGESINPLVIAHHGRLLITHHGVSRLPDAEF